MSDRQPMSAADIQEIREGIEDPFWMYAPRDIAWRLLCEVDRLHAELASVTYELGQVEDILDVTRSERDAREHLADAIRTHRSQKADDRCWLDDDRLYEALGDGIKCDRRVGNPLGMHANCWRFIQQRCESGGPWKSYAELEAENERLTAELAHWKEIDEQSPHLLASREELQAVLCRKVRWLSESLARETALRSDLEDTKSERDTARTEAAALREAMEKHCAAASSFHREDGDEYWRGAAEALQRVIDERTSAAAAASLQAEMKGLREANADYQRKLAEASVVFVEMASSRFHCIPPGDWELLRAELRERVKELEAAERLRTSTPSSAEFAEMAKQSQVPPELRGGQEEKPW